MQDLKVEYLPVSSLREYERNARKHEKEDVDAIIASIREFGFLDPIGIWSEQNIIVEGHGRLLAARELDMETVPCIRLDELTDEQRRAYALAHNRTAELSGWDFDLLDVELLNIAEIDMQVLGFLDVSSVSTPEQWDDPEPLEDIIPKDELDEYERKADENILVKRRVILTYMPEQEGRVKKLFGLEDGDEMRIVYDIDDLPGAAGK